MYNIEHKPKIQDHVRHAVLILTLFVDFVMYHFTSSHNEYARQRRHAYQNTTETHVL